MRILLINSGLRHGGAETQIIYLCNAFVKAGHEVSLYLLTPEADRRSELPESVSVVQGHKSSPFDVAEVRRLRAFIKSWKPDIVKSFLFDANFYARVAVAGTGLPVINGERNDNYKLNRNQALAHYPTRFLADAVVANTHAGRRFAQGLFGIAVDRTHVVWNGIDLERVNRSVPNAEQRECIRREHGGGGARKIVVVVGTIRESKDHMLALKVCKKLVKQDPAWLFWFVGDAPAGLGHYRSKAAAEDAVYKQQVFAFVESQGLLEHALFLGKRDDVIALIASADVLLSTSVREGFPNVVLEAMAAGTPVHSTAYSDIDRILPMPWQVSSDRSPDGLAAGVRRVLGERDAVSDAQRRFVVQEATAEISAHKMLKVFEQYAGKERRA